MPSQTRIHNVQPILEIDIAGSIFQALVDTGSSISLVGSRAQQVALEAGALLDPIRTTIQLAVGHSESHSSIVIPFIFQGLNITHSFTYLSDLLYDVVLGRDFLECTGMVIDIAHNQWHLENQVGTFVKWNDEHSISQSQAMIITGQKQSVSRDSITENMLNTFLTDLPPATGQKARQLLADYEDIFTDLPGLTSLTEHNIDTGDSLPIRCRLRPINDTKRAILDEQIDALLVQGLIRPTSSPWASAPVLVPKKSGGYRLAVDYRRLNKITKTPTWPMARTDWLLAQLGKAEWFSTIDLSQGFFQIPVAPNDIQKTAFLCHRGKFEFVRMPFGVSGGPATFQKTMDKVFSTYLHDFCLTFLDDIIIYSKSLDDHIDHLRQVFSCLQKAGFTANPKKLQLFKRKLQFLGHVISPGQCRPDPSKVSVVKDFSVPTSIKELQSFLGLAGYYRSFIKGFASMASPLTKLLQKNTPWRWEQQEEQSFISLKEALANQAVMSLPDLNRPFTIETDASGTGLGAVLLQENVDTGLLQPIAFISRALRQHEKQYTVQEWECLSVVWAVDKFRPYIEMASFTVLCDHASLSWMFSTEVTSNRVKRWVLRLQGMNCVIKYRKGASNIPADTLSRYPPREVSDEPSINQSWIGEEVFPLDVPNEPPGIKFETSCVISKATGPPADVETLQNISELHRAQLQDDELAAAISYLLSTSPSPNTSLCPRIKTIVSESTLTADGILVNTSAQGQDIIWLPSQLRGLVLEICHSSPLGGHMGYWRTLHKIRQNYVWLGMRKDIRDFVRSCPVCQTSKPRNTKPSGFMDSTPASQPFLELSIDLIGPLPRTAHGHKYILFILDKFTRNFEAYAIREPSSRAVVDKVEEYFCRFGFPLYVSSDNGKQFISRIWNSVMKRAGIQTRHTVPYRPCGQQVERHNGTLKTALRCFCRDHTTWDMYLHAIGFAMRTSVSEATGMTPAFLTYGRELRNP